MKHLYSSKSANFLCLFFGFLLFSLANHYIDITYERSNLKDNTKVDLIFEQVASRLALFTESRERAVDLLAQNWPDTHPNIQQWFTQQSLDIMQILPGIYGLWYVEENPNGDLLTAANGTVAQQWQVLSAQASAVGDSIDVAKLLPLHTITTAKSAIISLEEGRKGIAMVTPRAANGGVTGWIICVLDVNETFNFMLGSYQGEHLYISAVVNEQSIVEIGQRDNTVLSQQQVSLGDIAFDITVGAPTPQFNQLQLKSLAFLVIALIAWLVSSTIRKSLKASITQQRFSAAFDSSLDGMLIFSQADNQLVLTSANNSAREMLPFLDERRDATKLNYQQFIETLGLSGYQYLIKAPKDVLRGKSFNHYYQLAEVHAPVKHIKIQLVKAGSNIAVTLRNVTERKLAEQQLQDREEKYRRLVDSLSGHFLYSLAHDGSFNYVSSSVEAILGLTPESIVEANSYMQELGDTNKLREQQLQKLIQSQCSVNYQLEYTNRFGQRKVIEHHDSPIIKDGELIAVEGIARDITKEKSLAEEVLFQANHDALTGLCNRYSFDSQLSDILARVRTESVSANLCYVDLDQFKLVNDSCGHLAGDELLRQLGALMASFIGEEHIVARLGGDEFGVIFVDMNTEDAKSEAAKLLTLINDFRFVWGDNIFKVGASIGMAPVSPLLSTEEIMKAADVACYVAKDNGRNKIHVYSDDDEDLNYHKSRMNWATRIQDALDNDKFTLFSQTIKPLGREQSSRSSFEVLLRMVDGDKLITPNLFIPAAERFNLMGKIDRWVVKNTFAHLEKHPDLVENIEKCAINLSGASITDMSFAEEIVELLNRCQIAPSKICFEVTETEAVSKLNTASMFIDRLRQLGCRFALDDFGAGMCSFAYLKNLPVDFIKIDGSFVKNLCREATDRAIVQSIDDIAKSLGKETIAEFVSDEATELVLEQIGVNYVQGYFIDEPKPLLTNMFAQNAA